MFDLKGKTAIVTGGNRGIGKVTCLKLAEMGANVAINHRAGSIADAEQVKAACEAFGVKAIQCWLCGYEYYLCRLLRPLSGNRYSAD